ncbi:tRNA lysidine(34) synthetase TilS [Marinobacter pelagius]|uniref:tRNA lysidine(34) synthetase TilS n=1 Tax=Marinobacter sp. C7 TaxID=2951363 RepID=UPI001EF11B3C|nr:tRNA lysidine(34) synthetase TilS [Marinobacter sp. C7]MCG7200023.1 tRNA lysidine(34) synthetase TilS [Marinobacter sp. C7]
MTQDGKPVPGFAWPEALCAPVRSLPEHNRLWIAFSGGLDSCLLLHTAAHCFPQDPCLRAVHINHQLQANAAESERFCRRTCEALGVELLVRRVDVEAGVGASGGGLEEAARHARYAVFEEILESGDLLLMAHHADDQAETVLFRLLRGTGVRGLAGMPRERTLGAGRLVRPLLEFDRARLSQWANEAGLEWVEDPSNAEERFDRNFLRQRILPALKERWPGLNARLRHSAAACTEQVALADRLAEIQWRDCAPDGRRLSIERLEQLPLPERKNLLRWWIRTSGYDLPSIRDWAQVIEELIHAREDGEPELVGAGFAIRRFRGRLYLVPDQPEPESAIARLVPGEPVRWSGWRIRLESASGHKQAPPAIRVSTRQGGERFHPLPEGPGKLVKKWLQEQGIPPWERARIPLVFRRDDEGETLIGIGDLWCSGQYSGSAPAAGWRLIVERDCD